MPPYTTLVGTCWVYMPPYYTLVGSLPTVHAVYTLCTDPVHVDGLLGVTVLTGTSTGLGLPLRKV